MTTRISFARRTLLKTAMGGLFLAPILRQRRSLAQAAGPKRIVLMFTPDSHPPEWWPQGTGTAFTLQEPLADFAGLEQQMLFIRRLNHAWTFDNHHEAGPPQLFTGAEWVSDSNRLANGPSIDQILLQETDLRGGTPVASVHLAAGGGGGAGPRSTISYSGSGQPMQQQSDPARAFRDIFDGVSFDGSVQPDPVATGPDPNQLALQQAEQTMTEIQVEELQQMQTFLGQIEREKLERHVEGLRDLQLQIQASDLGGSAARPAIVSGECAQVDTSGVERNDRDADATTRWAQVQAELLVNAFTCDRTRVGELRFSFSGGHHEGLLGLDVSWHDRVAHISGGRNGTTAQVTDESGSPVTVGGELLTAREAFIRFDRFWASHVAYLVRRLSTIPEGDGSMLDNTVMVWGVESGTDHNHSPRDLQYLVMGGGNLGFQLGQFVDVGEKSSNSLLTSIMNAFGHEVNGIGIEPDVGPLAGIVA